MKIIKESVEELEEVYDNRLAKALGSTIEQTSHPTGQGDKYKKYITFVKGNPKLFKGVTKNSYLVAHHLNCDHSDDRVENIGFLVFNSHSQFSSNLISLVDEIIEENRYDYDELDYLARIKQINIYIDKLNHMYKDMDKEKFPEIKLINIDTSYIDYVKTLFKNDDAVEQIKKDLLSSMSVPLITLSEIISKMGGS